MVLWGQTPGILGQPRSFLEYYCFASGFFVFYGTFSHKNQDQIRKDITAFEGNGN